MLIPVCWCPPHLSYTSCDWSHHLISTSRLCTSTENTFLPNCPASSFCSSLYVFISFYLFLHPLSIFPLPRVALPPPPCFLLFGPFPLYDSPPPPLLTVTGNFASLPFCSSNKGGRCPLAGYVTRCHMRRTLWDGQALSAVTTQITSTASHLISTSNSISGN